MNLRVKEEYLLAGIAKQTINQKVKIITLAYFRTRNGSNEPMRRILHLFLASFNQPGTQGLQNDVPTSFFYWHATYFVTCLGPSFALWK